MNNRYRQQLAQWRQTEDLRWLRNLEIRGEYIRQEARSMVNLSSNEYMGIGAANGLWHQFLQEESSREDFGGGACSSRLLTGNHPAYLSLEQKLAEWYGKESALVLDSGYHANLGILPALSSSRDLILSDKLVHASLIDGIRLSPAASVRFRHNDWEQLENILKKSEPGMIRFLSLPNRFSVWTAIEQTLGN